MLLRTLLPLISIISATRAFTIPEHVQDGIYAVTIDDAGLEVHKRLSDLPSPSSTDISSPVDALISPPIPHIFRRAVTLYCGCGHNMNPGNCDAAVAAVKDQLNSNESIPANYSFYVIAGSVVAFFCNKNERRPFGFMGEMFGIKLLQITATCGRYVAGTYGFHDQYDLGYMNHYPGLDFCRAATASAARSC